MKPGTTIEMTDLYGRPNEQKFFIPGKPTDGEVQTTINIHVVGKPLESIIAHIPLENNLSDILGGAVPDRHPPKFVTARIGLNAWAVLCATGPRGLLSDRLLGLPFVKSELSGEPAYEVYLNDRFNGRKPRILRLKLTIDEMTLMGRLALKPEHFKKLLASYGVFFEIHDDFYDPESGEAVQAR